MTTSKLLVSSSALERAIRIRDLSEELNDRQQALEKRLSEEQAKTIEEYRAFEILVVAEVEAEWNQLCDELKIPATERTAWHLHASFLRQHGLAFVVWDEQKAQHLALIQSRLLGDADRH